MKRDCDFILVVKIFFFFESIIVGLFALGILLPGLLVMVLSDSYTFLTLLHDLISLSKAWWIFLIIGILVTLTTYVTGLAHRR